MLIRLALNGLLWLSRQDSHLSDMDTLHCEQLVVAAGMTSKPVMPKIDTSAFVGQVFHSKEFGQRHKWLVSDAVKNMTLVGGNKSSFKVARLCSLAGKRVTWLIGPDGQGPGIMLDGRRGDRHISEQGYARCLEYIYPRTDGIAFCKVGRAI
jgi:hypothetical protein